MSALPFNYNSNIDPVERENAPVHRIFVIDCSGSMHGDIDLIKQQLCNKLPTLVRPQDFLTIIWFSGRGSYGVIQEHVALNDAEKLASVQEAINRYLKSMGSTGFVEPIRLAKKIASKYLDNTQVYFLSDGGENCWPQDECVKEFENLNLPLIIVEYRWYCDRTFLQLLADVSGATSIFSENFDKLKPNLDNFFTCIPKSKTIPIKSEVDVFGIVENSLQIFPSVSGNVFIPEDSQNLYTLNPDLLENNTPEPLVHDSTSPSTTNDEKTEEKSEEKPSASSVDYLSLSYAFKRRNDEVFRRLMTKVGDIYFAERYNTCFSKQDHSRLLEDLLEAVNDETKRFQKGKSANPFPPDDVFTVIDFLKTIESDESARFWPYKMSSYTKISKESHSDFKVDKTKGFPFTLVWNQSRANCSLGCAVSGHHISTAEDGTEVMKEGKSFRNYAVLKDGIKNIEILPLSFSQDTFDLIRGAGYISTEEEWEEGKVFSIDIRNCPIINRKYALSSNLDSKEFFTASVKRLVYSAELKYLKSLLKHLAAQKEEGETEPTEFERKKFDPTEVRDFYEATEFVVKIKGCSSLPTVNEKLFAKLDGKKQTLVESLMLRVHKQFKSSSEEEINAEIGRIKRELYGVSKYLEKVKFAILVAKAWFLDVDAENPIYEITVNVNGEDKDFTCDAEFKTSKVYLD